VTKAAVERAEGRTGCKKAETAHNIAAKAKIKTFIVVNLPAKMTERRFTLVVSTERNNQKQHSTKS